MTRTHCQLDIDEKSFFLRHQKCLIWDQKWPNMAGLPMSRCGPKGSQMVPNVFGHLGHFWAHLDPFGPFQTKLDFLLQTTLAKKHFVFLRRKIDFCLKRSQMVQMGPNGPKWSKTCYIDHLGPFGTIWDPFGPHRDIGMPAMLGHFWSQMDHFWTPPDLEWDLERG